MINAKVYNENLNTDISSKHPTVHFMYLQTNKSSVTIKRCKHVPQFRRYDCDRRL